MTRTSSPELQAIWQACANAVPTPPDEPPPEIEEIVEQYLILVTYRDEKEQVALLERFRGDGLECRALVS